MQILDEGTDNQVELPEASTRLSGTIRLKGDGNRVSFGANCSGRGLRFDLKGGVHVVIGEGCRLGSLRIHAVSGSEVHIGPRSVFNGRSRLLMHEAASITLGAACLVGSECTFMASDVHSVLDAVSGLRLNPARNITIGEHVWIAGGVTILKGTEIGRDTVIGTRSVVAGKLPPSVVAAGNPARVVREGVTWDNRLL